MGNTKRLRIIAGPNGSGKSTLVEQLKQRDDIHLGDVLNADVLLVALKNQSVYQTDSTFDFQSLLSFVKSSTYTPAVKNHFFDHSIYMKENGLYFSPQTITPEIIAVFTEYLKEHFLAQECSFSFETVFSHPSKIDFIRRAFENGYRTYLYFVATEDPNINIERVTNRVKQGGHDVPVEKICSRYNSALNNIVPTIPYLSRGYFFDNSTQDMQFCLEYDANEPKIIKQHVDNLPFWLRNIFQPE